MSEKCPNGLTPDGPVCPRCGGDRGPSGVDGGSWVHCPSSSVRSEIAAPKFLCVNRTGCETPNDCREHGYCRSPNNKDQHIYSGREQAASSATAATSEFAEYDFHMNRCMAYGAQWCHTFRDYLDGTGSAAKADEMRDGLRKSIHDFVLAAAPVENKGTAAPVEETAIAFREASERFAKAIVDCDAMEADHDDRDAMSDEEEAAMGLAYEQACNEYNESKRLMAEAWRSRMKGGRSE